MRGLTCVVLLLLLASGVHAADEGETIVQAKDTLDAIVAARKAKDVEALETAFVRLVELHNGMEGADWRKKLRSAVGDVLKDKKTPELHRAAVSALEQLDDGDGVYEQLKKMIPKPKDKTADEMQLYAIGIIGTLRSPAGSKALLELAAKGVHLPTRAAAIAALGRYRAIGKVRDKVFQGLLQLLLDVDPGDDPSDAQRTVWHELEEPIVKSLDELTHTDLGSGQKWIEWHASNKSRLKDVFDDVDADDD